VVRHVDGLTYDFLFAPGLPQAARAPAVRRGVRGRRASGPPGPGLGAPPGSSQEPRTPA